MIDYETFMKIKSYHQKDGLNCNQIAALTGLSFKTVNKWLNAKHYHMRKAADRSSKLDPFKNQIVQMLEKYPYSGISGLILDQIHRLRSIPITPGKLGHLISGFDTETI